MSKSLKEKIEVMQAALDGKEIQVTLKGADEWFNSIPMWNWDANNYRIKPEPMEFWVLMVEGSNTPSIVEESKEYLSQFRNGGRIIKVREVTDE